MYRFTETWVPTTTSVSSRRRHFLTLTSRSCEDSPWLFTWSASRNEGRLARRRSRSERRSPPSARGRTSQRLTTSMRGSMGKSDFALCRTKDTMVTSWPRSASASAVFKVVLIVPPMPQMLRTRNVIRICFASHFQELQSLLQQTVDVHFQTPVRNSQSRRVLHGVTRAQRKVYLTP